MRIFSKPNSNGLISLVKAAPNSSEAASELIRRSMDAIIIAILTFALGASNTIKTTLPGLNHGVMVIGWLMLAFAVALFLLGCAFKIRRPQGK